MPDDNEEEKRQQSARALSEHDQLMERSAAHAARDVLHDASAGQEAGAYTTQEARDRAHTPSILDRDGPRNRAEEAQMIDALYRELFPKQHESPTTNERPADVTPEQQRSINKALERADINDKMGGASEVSGKPQPNDPTPLDKAREIGQDLRNKDLILDK